MVRPMQRVIIHVSDLIRITACTNSLKNIPDTLGFSPSLRNIIDNRAKHFLKLFKFLANSGQSSSYSVMILPRYFNDLTKFGDIT